jgi:hypothetical protein
VEYIRRAIDNRHLVKGTLFQCSPGLMQQVDNDLQDVLDLSITAMD